MSIWSIKNDFMKNWFHAPPIAPLIKRFQFDPAFSCIFKPIEARFATSRWSCVIPTILSLPTRYNHVLFQHSDIISRKTCQPWLPPSLGSMFICKIVTCADSKHNYTRFIIKERVPVEGNGGFTSVCMSARRSSVFSLFPGNKCDRKLRLSSHLSRVLTIFLIVFCRWEYHGGCEWLFYSQYSRRGNRWLVVSTPSRAILTRCVPARRRKGELTSRVSECHFTNYLVSNSLPFFSYETAFYMLEWGRKGVFM